MSVPHDAPSEAGAETPNLDFEGTTPYEDYVQADVLTHLQHPLSDDPGEMVFLVTTQVMELWFTVLVHEWRDRGRARCAATTCPPRWPRCAAAPTSWSRSTPPGSRWRT